MYCGTETGFQPVLSLLVRPCAKELVLIASYQSYLIAAHLLGGGVGDRMTTWLAKLFGAPSLKPGWSGAG
jgi:hypothetical protein